MSSYIDLMITNVIVDPTQNKYFGFATDDEGTEYFLPRATILANELTSADIGVPFRGRIRKNPSPIEGKANLDHVMPDMRFEDDEEVGQ